SLGQGGTLILTPDETPFTVWTYATDANGCNSDTLSMTVLNDPPLQVFGQPSEETEICQFECIDMSVGAVGGNGNYSYSWFEVDPFGDVPLGTTNVQSECPMEDTSYYIWVDDGCQYPAVDSIFIVVNETPDAEIQTEVIGGCYPFTVTIENNTDPDLVASCIWDLNNGDIIADCGDLEYTYLEEGEYWPTLTVTSEEGCSNTDSLDWVLTAYGYPEADFIWEPDPITTLANEVQFLNTSSGAISYSWDIAGMLTTQWPTPSFTFPPQDLAIFPVCLQAINEFGCVDTLCQDIFVESELLLYSPNAFTPDNDGLNDVFLPEIGGISSDGYLFRIFDRWGHIIFETNQRGVPWIGEFNNGDHYVQNDVYIWQIEAVELATGDKKRFTGTVVMAR
ncbi:MAG: hypothetical protein HKN32_07445, partial [Flavobacteriales bacterium]|nr:hypothetical protein [Flavobacteriales bacterium]